MTRPLHIALAGAALAFAQGAWAGDQAVNASFSYDFGDGHLFSGSLSGVLHDQGTASTADDYIDTITQLSARFDGTSMRGPLTLNAYDGSGFRGPGSSDPLPARLYLDIPVSGKGIDIVNCADLNACIAASGAHDYNYFILRTGASPAAQFYDLAPSQPEFVRSGASTDPWTLTISAVPEPSGALMLALGLGALGLVRRPLVRGGR